MPTFYQNTSTLKKKHTIVKPIFCEKNVPFSQKHCALVTFSQIFSWITPCCDAHIGSKNVNSLKITLYFWSKKSIRCPSFSIFRQKKITAVVPIFVQKLSILWTTHCYHAHFLSKTRPFSQKTHCSYIFFVKFLMKNQLLSCHILSKKLQFCQNYLKYVIFSQKHFDLMSFFVLNFLW